MAQIFVIDDELMIREMLRDLLSGAGHTVTLASNGREAITVARDRTFDLVITDIFMPEKDGLEAISSIRRSCQGAKIIAISGGSRIRGAEVLQWALKAGADFALQKPVEQEELLSAVTQCLEAAASHKT